MLEILVIEAGRLDAGFLGALLGDLTGVEIQQAQSVKRGCSALVDEDFAAVILDAELARSVPDAVEDLRAANPKTAIIVVADDDADAIACLTRGAQEYFLRDDVTRRAFRRALDHATIRVGQASQLPPSSAGSTHSADPELLEEATRRAAREASEETTIRLRAEFAQRPAALPDPLLVESVGTPSTMLLDGLGQLLRQKEIQEISLEDIADAAHMELGLLSRRSRPTGNVMVALVARDNAAEAELLHTLFQNAKGTHDDVSSAMVFVVQTFAAFYGAATEAIKLGARFAGIDGRLRNLRFEHVCELATIASDFMGTHVQEVPHSDPIRAIELATDQLLALLDQQLLLGPIHPSEGTAEEVIHEVADQITSLLLGPVAVRRGITEPNPVVESELTESEPTEPVPYEPEAATPPPRKAPSASAVATAAAAAAAVAKSSTAKKPPAKTDPLAETPPQSEPSAPAPRSSDRTASRSSAAASARAKAAQKSAPAKAPAKTAGKAPSKSPAKANAKAPTKSTPKVPGKAGVGKPARSVTETDPFLAGAAKADDAGSAVGHQGPTIGDAFADPMIAAAEAASRAASDGAAYKGDLPPIDSKRIFVHSIEENADHLYGQDRSVKQTA